MPRPSPGVQASSGGAPRTLTLPERKPSAVYTMAGSGRLAWLVAWYFMKMACTYGASWIRPARTKM